MILIVDDHIDTCRALLLLLKREGVPAQCVDYPGAALSLIESLNCRARRPHRTPVITDAA